MLIFASDTSAARDVRARLSLLLAGRAWVVHAGTLAQACTVLSAVGARVLVLERDTQGGRAKLVRDALLAWPDGPRLVEVTGAWSSTVARDAVVMDALLAFRGPGVRGRPLLGGLARAGERHPFVLAGKAHGLTRDEIAGLEGCSPRAVDRYQRYLASAHGEGAGLGAVLAPRLFRAAHTLRYRAAVTRAA